MLISVLTPRYLKSDWCTRELWEFCKAAEQSGGMALDNKSRVIKVIKTPVENEDALPSLVKEMLGYWTVPFATRSWSANSVGTMNEACIEDLMYSLEEEGKQEWANQLRALWETKVAHFVLDTPNLYGSEFAFDSTGFESTQAFARYAIRNAGKHHVDPPQFAVGPRRNEIPDFSKVTPEAARKFADFQMQLNVNDRGWIETAYYLLGTDYRGSTSYLQSYMSHLGGWAVLDHALNFADNPTGYLRLGYSSALSAWCLVNSGTA
jgi:hypothetical protein